jgi:DNA-binding response OmpR family regulator
LDGEEGFALALKNNYDVIILDNVLPGKEGKEICQELREKACCSPILILSVKSELETKVDLLNIGADDYMTKPFSLDELLARVKVLARRPKHIEGEILQLGDLVLNLVNKTVKCKGKDVSLTRKEFSILACLVKNRGKALNREQIMRYVWDEYVDPFSNTLEAHIVQIRKKIGALGKKANIQTVNGIGYRIGQEDD